MNVAGAGYLDDNMGNYLTKKLRFGFYFPPVKKKEKKQHGLVIDMTTSQFAFCDYIIYGATRSWGNLLMQIFPKCILQLDALQVLEK